MHGSAPDIFGKNIANPIAMIWSGALMLEFLGNDGADPRYRAAHDDILKPIEQVIAAGDTTRDMGGQKSTQEVGRAITALIEG
ncbi:Tartrate dehydrogenase/decarboxylase [compost metagenome]